MTSLRSKRPRSFALSLAMLLSAAGCNAIFGIDAGDPRDAGLSDVGGAGGGTGSSSGDAGGTGVAGSGGETGGGGAASGSGGATCDPYAGGGSIEIVVDSMANVPTFSYDADYSVSGHYDRTSRVTEFSIAGSHEPYCNVGVRVTFANQIVAGSMYRAVTREVYEGPNFHGAANVFMTFGVTQPDPGCTETLLWESIPSSGVVRVDEIEGSKVTLVIADISLSAVTTTPAEGGMIVRGSAHADCFALE